MRRSKGTKSSSKDETAPVQKFWCARSSNSAFPCAFLSQSPPAYADASLRPGLDSRTTTSWTEAPVS
jgi:hypothetical protein